MNLYKVFYLLALIAPCALNSSTITLSFRPYPDQEDILQALKQPGMLAQHKLKALGNPNQITGVLATYAGFLETSNTDGFIIFPRKHTNPSVNLLITNQITPIVMFEQTIQNWQIVPHVPAQMYHITRTEDEETELNYWQVEKAELPEDMIIPLDTIIIIAEPKNVHIPTGASLSDAGANFILPNIYIRKGIHTVDNSLYMLQIAHLFRPVQTMHTQLDQYRAVQLHE